MLIASLSCGDTLVTLVQVIPLDIEELKTGTATFNLTFTDIPTDRRYTKSYVGENEALHALAAWIAADDQHWVTITAMLLELQKDPAMKNYMP